MEPISGKHDKKSIVSAYCKNKTTIYHDRALLVFRLDLSWHVVSSSPRHGENTAFFSGFPLGGIPRLTHFAGYPFGASRKKTAAVFYGTAYCKNKPTICHDRTLLVFRLDLSWHVVGSSPQHGEHTAFFSGFPLGGIHG